MKRSKTSIIVVIIGLVIAVLAPVWKWAIAPVFISIPDDLNIMSVYEGTLKLYADAEKMQFYPKGQEVTLPITITRLNTSVPEKGDSEAAVVREQVEALDPDGEVIITWDKYFAMDRKNAVNLAGHNSDRDREGYYIMLPMGAEKITYKMWDDDTEQTADARFLREETRDGNKHNCVTVYVYEAVGGLDPMVEPPLGLPTELSGKEIKKILNDPNLALPDDAMLPIEYLKKGSATVVVEPRTGFIVDLPKYHEEYFLNAALPGQPANNIPMAVLDYQQTDANVKDTLDDAAWYFAMLDLVTMWLPLTILLVGLILFLIGLLLGVRDKGQGAAEEAAPAGEPEDE